jgi:Xaa-Pro aminopeptidase
MNRDRLTQLMRDHDVGVVVAVAPHNVCYLTGHIGWAQHVYRSLPCLASFTDDGSEGTDLVVPRSETPYHATNPSDAERVAAYGGRAGMIPEDADWVPSDEEARFEELQRSCAAYSTPADALLALLADRDIAGRRIVVDDEFAVAGLMDRLRDAFPSADVVAGEGLLLLARHVKTPDEIERLRRAAAVNEAAVRVAADAVRTGVGEREVASAWRREIGAAGAVPLWFHLGSGRRSAYVFPPSEKSFERGDLFMFDAGLVFDGLLADTGACGSIGEPSERARKEYTVCAEAMAAAESVIAEGVLPSTIFGALRSSLDGTVLDSVHVPFAGHTIGYEAREFPFVLGPASPVRAPFLPETSDIPLPAGSTINVEIPLGRLGWGGYQIEKSYVVRPGGFEPLLDSGREFLVRP